MPDIVDAVLTASRTLVAVTERSLGTVAEDTTIAQYRALVVLASRGPQRMVDLAVALGVTPSTAGRMCDRLLRKGLIRRHRARADRREVLVSVTAAGRQVVDQATARRRALLAEILGRLPAEPAGGSRGRTPGLRGGCGGDPGQPVARQARPGPDRTSRLRPARRLRPACGSLRDGGSDEARPDRRRCGRTRQPDGCATPGPGCS